MRMLRMVLEFVFLISRRIRRFLRFLKCLEQLCFEVPFIQFFLSKYYVPENKGQKFTSQSFMKTYSIMKAFSPADGADFYIF